MARNGSGEYSLPAGSIVTNGDTSDQTDVNTPLQDIAADLNVARPIVAGGTGATSASGARTALGVAIGSDVLAYDADLDDLTGITDVIKRLAIGNNPPEIGDTSVTDESIAAGPYEYTTGGSSTGGPAGVTSANFWHFRRASAGGEAQICLPDGPEAQQGRIYIRSRTTAAWSDWESPINTSDVLDEDNFSTNSATYPPSQQSTKAYVDGVLGTKFESSEAALGALSETTTAHGLGATPARLQLVLKCITNDVNYTAGEEVLCPSVYYNGTKYVNAQILADSTNIYIKWASEIELISTSGTVQTIDAAKWRFIASAWST